MAAKPTDPTERMPDWTVVVPVKVLAPETIQVPAPPLVRLFVLPSIGASVLAPVFEPVRVKVFAEVVAMVPVLVKLKVPAPEELMVPAPFMVKRRSVLLPEPVYWSVVPFQRTRFPAALPEAPIELLAAPLAREVTLKVPALTDVAPV